jgi:hypothetical protein
MPSGLTRSTGVLDLDKGRLRANWYWGSALQPESAAAPHRSRIRRKVAVHRPFGRWTVRSVVK